MLKILRKIIKTIFFSLLLVFSIWASSFEKNNSVIDSLNMALLTATEENKPIIINKLARSHMNQSPEKSIKYGKHVLRLQRSSDRQLAKANFTIGEGYENLGDFSKAITYYHHALSLYKKVSDSLNVAHTLNSIGYVYWYLNDYEQANAFFQQSITLCEQVDYSFGLARNYNHLGLIYWKKGAPKKALRHYKKSMTYAQKIDNYDRIAAVLNNIAVIKLEQEKYDTALDYLQKSLSIHEEKVYNSWAIVENKNNIARVYIEKEKYQKAKKILKESENLAQQINSKIRLNETNDLLAYLYEKMGDSEKSLTYYKKWVALNTKILSEEQVKRVAEIESSFELEQKEKEIELLKVENKLRETKLNHHRAWLFYLTILLLISVAAIGTITLLFIKKNNAYKHLVDKNEKIMVVEKERDQLLQKVKQLTNHHDKDEIKYAGSSLSDQRKEKLAEKIRGMMETEQLYLDKNMTTREMAEKLNTNRTYLSQVVNAHFGKRFSQFVNEYRVKDAKIRLSNGENKKYTIEYIAHSVGFRSVNAFNKAFKKDTGVTPSFYIKSLEEKKKSPDN